LVLSQRRIWRSHLTWAHYPAARVLSLDVLVETLDLHVGKPSSLSLVVEYFIKLGEVIVHPGDGTIRCVISHLYSKKVGVLSF
jgi:hypothetical protein